MDEIIQEKIAKSIGLKSKREGVEKSFKMSDIAQTKEKKKALENIMKLENSIVTQLGRDF